MRSTILVKRNALQARWGAVAAAFACVSACGGQHAGGGAAAVNGPGREWPQQYWNPMPADDDLVIEGPCGARFAFRPVSTPTEANWLADVSVDLGQSATADEGALRALTEQVRQGSVVGAFAAGEDPAKRLYYLGKYEVTLDQYAAVMGEGCPNPGDAGAAPVDKVSRFDAESFARRLSEYGFAHKSARDRLPATGGTPAFVRLPTEAEWEFAARGGAAVTLEERLAPAYPMDPDISQFEWVEGDQSCRGSLQTVGLLRPNPLGLHDMLGNVAELVIDPFQVNRGGRLHGQPGGAMAKGGSCALPPEQARSASRTEYPDYDVDKGKANAPEFVGFRLALGAPAIPSNQRLSAFEKDWDAMRRPHTLREGSESPSAALRRLAAQLPDVRVAEAIARGAAAFDTELARRSEIEAESARAAVSNGALLIRNYRFVSSQIEVQERSIGILRKQGLGEQAAVTERSLSVARQLLRLTRDLYTQLLVNAAGNFPPAVLADARSQVSNQFRQRYASAGAEVAIADMACVFAAQARRYAVDRPPTFEDYLKELTDSDSRRFAAACR